MTARSTARLGLLVALFVIGFALMGFEMLGSRYLNPYFGGGITTWASLISVVLFSMMVGYFGGGYAVDAWPGVGLLALSVALAAACMLIVPQTADAVLLFILQTLGDGFVGVFTASTALSLVPVAFLSACSPFAVRLLLVDLESGGKTAGVVYSVSTLGNVAGTLATTFYMIPNLGVRTITTWFGLVLAALAALLFLGRARLSKGVRTAAAAAAVTTGAMVGIFASPAHAEPADRAAWPASYPEGPLWLGERLLYAEMAAHKVVEWRSGKRRDFWSEPGCGPTAISAFRGSELIVLCHFARKLVHLNAAGRRLGEIAAAADGERFQDPNDGHTDGRGGVFFTDPGSFRPRAPATGKVFHLAADGTVRKVLDGLHYANGIAVDFANRRVLVSEHLARRVWQLDLADDLTLANRRVFLDVGRHLGAGERGFPLTGPDGIEVDRSGYVFVAVYGARHILMVTPDGRVGSIGVSMPYVTNIAVAGQRAAVVGAFVYDRPPFPGRVEIVPRRSLIETASRTAAPAP